MARKKTSTPVPIIRTIESVNESLNRLEERAKNLLLKKPQQKDRIESILNLIKRIRVNIAANDVARQTYDDTRWLNLALYNTGLLKPLYMDFGRWKGGRALKRPIGILLAMEKVLSTKKKILGPLWLWKIFERERFEIDGYEIFYYNDQAGLKENDLLCQRDFAGKEHSIKFKTFERWYYKILKEKPGLKNH